jgi:hypothetical protein
MLDDAPFPCNIVGEDVLYKIYVPFGADVLFISLSNASASMLLSLEVDTCGIGPCNTIATVPGNSNVAFNVPATSYYYLWVDAADTVIYTICFGGDTASTYLNIPNTQGNLQLDSSVCALPPFSSNKLFLQVSYNSVIQTNPMTLPLFMPGSLCLTTFFKNTTGIEAVKKFKFTFNPAGFSLVTAAPTTVSGFYNAGNWIATNVGNEWTFEFFDLAAIDKGDFFPPPDTCLAYTFCFTVIPISNSPNLTNVDVLITSDGFGAGFNGWVHYGCCPASYANCLNSSSSSSGGSHSFGFSINDPAAPLPVNLIAFEAKQKKDIVIVSWTTASEINNDFFSVERGLNGNDWTEIRKVKGAGNSSVTRFYQYRDEHPAQDISYYRLKQTDYDGSFTYSEIRQVHMKNGNDIFVFPNPARTELTIMSSEKITEVSLASLFNMEGEKVSAPIIIKQGEVLLNVSALARGLYFLVMEEDGAVVKREKIILQD